MINRKAQGTIEYLVIIAIVIVIALVVVGLLLQIMGQGSGISENSAKAAWRSGTPWSVDWTRSSSNGWTFSFKNVSADTLSLNGISLGSGDYNLSAAISNIGPGGIALVSFTGTPCTTGARYSIPKTTPIYIDFNTSTIGGMRQYANADISGTC